MGFQPRLDPPGGAVGSDQSVPLTDIATFTEAQKVDIRRYCGYPAYGLGPSGFQGWRFWQAYGLLEFRLNNMAQEEANVVLNIYVNPLHALEQEILGASRNLSTDKAASWTRNRGEVGDRDRLFANWRRKLCAFLGIPPGDALSNSCDLVV